MLDMVIDKPSGQINYEDKIMLIGSCFSEEIGNKLSEHKFNIFQNPNGIIFDPESIYRCLSTVIANSEIDPSEIIQHNKVYHSMDHHSGFSSINKSEVVDKINKHTNCAHLFLKNAKWLIITFGTSVNYQLIATGKAVANCHKIPGKHFRVKDIGIEEIVNKFTALHDKLNHFNPELDIIYTVSPVRHIRDGIVKNNLSKARLIVAVHQMIAEAQNKYYFPAYELAIDVLRDYRFYDTDLVHPNSQAVAWIFEKFVNTFLDKRSLTILDEIKKWKSSIAHKPHFPESEAYKEFMHLLYNQTKQLNEKYPFLDLQSDLINIQRQS